MKKNYNKPSLIVTRFNSEDIITTSGLRTALGNEQSTGFSTATVSQLGLNS